MTSSVLRFLALPGMVPTMKLAPSQWKGSARRMIEEVLKPHFIPANRVELWHAFLLKKMNETDGPFILTAPATEMKSRIGHEKSFLTKQNLQVIFGDSSQATAVFTYLNQIESLTNERAAALLMHLPHHAFDMEKFTRWANFTNNTLSAGWYTGHLKGPVGADANWESLSRDELRLRTLRNLHPLNIFIFPNLNKSGAVFAEDPRFLSLMSESYAQFYGPLWSSFREILGETAPAADSVEDFEIDLSATSKVSTGVQLESKELVTKIDPTQAFDLKLITVSESQGSHSRTIDPNLMSRGFFDFKLDFKDKAGAVRTIGFFRLNLKDLYEKKYLGRDSKGLRFLVYHTEQGFSVGPKKTGPLIALPI